MGQVDPNTQAFADIVNSQLAPGGGPAPVPQSSGANPYGGGFAAPVIGQPPAAPPPSSISTPSPYAQKQAAALSDAFAQKYGVPETQSGAQASPSISPVQPQQAPAQQPLMLQSRTVPGGFDPSRLPFKQSTLAEEGKLYDQRGNLMQQDANIEAAKADRLALQARQDQQQNAAIYAQQQKDELDRRAYMDQQRSKAQKLVDDAANMKVDPNRMYGHADTGTRIGLMVGGFLGGLAGGWSHSPNAFVEQMNKNIDRDIDAQKDQIANATRRGQSAQNMLSDLRSQLGDERLADNAYRQMVLAQQSQRMGALAQESDSARVKSQAALGINALSMERNNLHKSYDQATHYDAHTVGGAGVGAGSADQNKLFVPTGPNGEGYLARDDKAADEGRQKVELYNDARGLVDLANSLRAQTSAGGRFAAKFGSFAESPEYSRLASAQAGFLGKLKLMEQTKSITPELADYVRSAVGDFTAVGGHPEARADQFLQGLRQSIDSHRRAQGGQTRQAALQQTNRGDYQETTLGMPAYAAPRAQMPKPVGGR